MLPLGKMQVNLLLPSLIRIFDFAEDSRAAGKACIRTLRTKTE